MRQYLDLLNEIVENGETQENERTGVGTRFIWTHNTVFSLRHGFPAVTTKNLYFKGVVHELLWMISGSTNIRYLVQNNVNIWNEWPYARYLKDTGQAAPASDSLEWKTGIKVFANRIVTDEQFALKYGDIGPNYGYQWRHFDGYLDQLAEVVSRVKGHSSSRRLLVMTWDPRVIDELAETSLPPCHYVYHFKVFDGKLYTSVSLRSWDVFLGGPFNIAQYALLTHMVAHVAGLEPYMLGVNSEDTHLYLNHLDLARIQIARSPLQLPTLRIKRPVSDIDDFRPDDFELVGYTHHPHLKGEIAV